MRSNCFLMSKKYVFQTVYGLISFGLVIKHQRKLLKTCRKLSALKLTHFLRTTQYYLIGVCIDFLIVNDLLKLKNFDVLCLKKSRKVLEVNFCAIFRT